MSFEGLAHSQTVKIKTSKGNMVAHGQLTLYILYVCVCVCVHGAGARRENTALAHLVTVKL